MTETRSTAFSQSRLRAGVGVGLAALALFAVLRVPRAEGFSFYPDEFSYWAYAAGMDGYDWSDIVSMGPYFSFGYSWLLFPIFALCKTPVTAYRVALTLNFFLLAGACALLARTVCTFLSMEGHGGAAEQAGFFAAFAVLAPWNLFYAQTTLTETLLLFLYVAAGALLLEYLKRGRLSTLLSLLAVLCYSYTVHMRTLGILVSALAALSVHILTGKGKGWHLALAAAVTLGWFWTSWGMKEAAIAGIYGEASRSLAAGNDYSGQLGQLRYLLTPGGIWDFLATGLGAFLYLGLASFGTFYWGMGVMFRSLLGEKSRPCRIPRASGEFSLFVLLSVALQVGIASVYLLRRGEVDDYTYGRYSELILPFVVTAGLAAMWEKPPRELWAGTGAMAVFQGMGLWLVVRQIRRTGAAIFHGYYMIGISYPFQKEGMDVGRFYLRAWCICQCLTLLLLLLCLAARGRGRGRLFAVAVCVELALTQRVDRLFLEDFQLGVFRDRHLAEKICAMVLPDHDRRVFFMDDGRRPSYIGLLQFYAREVDIQVLDAGGGAGGFAGLASLDDILIFPNEGPESLESPKEWMEDAFAGEDAFERKDTYGHFTLLYR